MNEIRIGRKTSNEGLAIHLEIDGRTCNSMRPVNVLATTVDETTRLCKVCFAPARLRRAQEIIANAPRLDANADRLLIASRAALATSAEKARIAMLTARLRNTAYARSLGVTPEPVEVVKPRSFAGLVAAYGTTPNAPAREHAARRANGRTRTLTHA